MRGMLLPSTIFILKTSNELEQFFQLLQAVDVCDPSTNEVATTLVLGIIKYIHIRKDIIDPQRGIVDP
jgi:hypothetical protein